ADSPNDLVSDRPRPGQLIFSTSERLAAPRARVTHGSCGLECVERCRKRAPAVHGRLSTWRPFACFDADSRTAAARVTLPPASKRALVVPEQRQQDDDREGNPEKPKQKSRVQIPSHAPFFSLEQ